MSIVAGNPPPSDLLSTLPKLASKKPPLDSFSVPEVTISNQDEAQPAISRAVSPTSRISSDLLSSLLSGQESSGSASKKPPLDPSSVPAITIMNPDEAQPAMSPSISPTSQISSGLLSSLLSGQESSRSGSKKPPLDPASVPAITIMNPDEAQAAMSPSIFPSSQILSS